MTVRLCLDLNIWCAAFLADSKGARGTAAQTLVEAARCGQFADRPVQLVVPSYPPTVFLWRGH